MLDNIRQTRLGLKAPLANPIDNGCRARPREAFKLYANVRPASHTCMTGPVMTLLICRSAAKIPKVCMWAWNILSRLMIPGRWPRPPASLPVQAAAALPDTFDYAIKKRRGKVTIAHRASTLKALIGLFLETARAVGQEYQERLEIEDRIVDNIHATGHQPGPI